MPGNARHSHGLSIASVALLFVRVWPHSRRGLAQGTRPQPTASAAAGAASTPHVAKARHHRARATRRALPTSGRCVEPQSGDGAPVRR
eukprot:scaffold40507_cov35-Tisochrysis_lutea.AAC.3